MFHIILETKIQNHLQIQIQDHIWGCRDSAEDNESNETYDNVIILQESAQTENCVSATFWSKKIKIFNFGAAYFFEINKKKCLKYESVMLKLILEYKKHLRKHCKIFP